jgi:hypothetical protein
MAGVLTSKYDASWSQVKLRTLGHDASQNADRSEEHPSLAPENIVLLRESVHLKLQQSCQSLGSSSRAQLLPTYDASSSSKRPQRARITALKTSHTSSRASGAMPGRGGCSFQQQQ